MNLSVITVATRCRLAGRWSDLIFTPCFDVFLLSPSKISHWTPTSYQTTDQPADILSQAYLQTKLQGHSLAIRLPHLYSVAHFEHIEINRGNKVNPKAAIEPKKIRCRFQSCGNICLTRWLFLLFTV